MHDNKENYRLWWIAGGLVIALGLVFSINQSIDGKLQDTPETVSEQAGDASDATASVNNDVTASDNNEPVVAETSAPARAPKGNELVAVSEPATQTSATVQQYINGLAAQGFSSARQGVWIQSEDTLLANHQGTVPLSAASLTKVATTLASLEVLGVDYRFSTLIGTNGTLSDGQLNGDLIVQGSGDPFFVWEEAIALGNVLNELGIRTVTGDLVIVDDFYMNFQRNALTSGDLLKEGLNSALWGGEAQAQFGTLPAGTARPQVSIQGSVRGGSVSDFQLLVNHQSLPLPELLKKMNQYSNNVMAEMLADKIGGGATVAQVSAQATGMPQNEISLINGSGLGVENRISPRAVSAMFLTIDNFLHNYDMTIADVFNIIGQDPGVLEGRALPPFAVLKSGSLSQASAIAGAIPTRDQGVVWFSIINEGNNLTGFRARQESLLGDLIYGWGAASGLPTSLKINPERASITTLNEVP